MVFPKSTSVCCQCITSLGIIVLKKPFINKCFTKNCQTNNHLVYLVILKHFDLHILHLFS